MRNRCFVIWRKSTSLILPFSGYRQHQLLAPPPLPLAALDRYRHLEVQHSAHRMHHWRVHSAPVWVGDLAKRRLWDQVSRKRPHPADMSLVRHPVQDLAPPHLGHLHPSDHRLLQRDSDLQPPPVVGLALPWVVSARLVQAHSGLLGVEFAVFWIWRRQGTISKSIIDLSEPAFTMPNNLWKAHLYGYYSGIYAQTSKSVASCRSRSTSLGSPHVLFTLRPRLTAGRPAISFAQRITFV